MDAFRPLLGRARWAVVVLAVAAAVDALAVAFDVSEWRLLERVETGELVTEEELAASDDRQAAIGFVQLLLLVVGAVVFIRWLNAAYRNLPVVGAGELRFAPGWAIGGWFVPFLNLWRPKQIVNDVWRASDPELPRDAGGQWWEGPVPAYFLGWWVFFTVSGWAGNLAFRTAFAEDEDAGGLQNTTLALLVADATSVLAALLAILVVRRTTARQEARAEQLRRSEPPPVRWDLRSDVY